MNQIYACRKGRDFPFTDTTSISTVPTAIRSGRRTVFSKILLVPLTLCLVMIGFNGFAQSSRSSTGEQRAEKIRQNALEPKAPILFPASTSRTARGAVLQTTQFCNPTAIAPVDGPDGVPVNYPSNITVSGMTGYTQKVTVTLLDFNSDFPDDADILLESPTGQRAVVMSDVGGNTLVTDADLTFDATAGGPAPDAGPIPSNAATTYQPTNIGAGDNFPAPGPGVFTSTNFNVFYGNFVNPNGVWKLYVVDDANLDIVDIQGGWCITVTTTTQCPGGPIHNVNTGLDYCTIQEAIDDAPTLNGHTINIDNGTYRENVNVTKELTIFGDNRAGVIIKPVVNNPCGGTLASVVFSVRANNVHIHTLTVDGNNELIGGAGTIEASSGIATNWPTGDYTNLEVNNVTVQNISLRGIYSVNNVGLNTFNFHDNTVTNVQGACAGLTGAGIFNWGNTGTINNNILTNNTAGIGTNQAQGTIITNNNITSPVGGTGIQIDNHSNTGAGFADFVQNNTISGGNDGIFIFQTNKNIVIDQNLIQNYNDFGITVASQDALFPGQGNPQITNNDINGGGNPTTTGIRLTTNNFGVAGTNPDNTRATVTNNNITGNTSEGLLIETTAGKTATLEAHFNNIQNPGFNARSTGAGTAVGNATCNWWGSIIFATVAAKITGPGWTFTPYLVSGVDANPGMRGFQTAEVCTGTCPAYPATITGAANTEICAGDNASVNIVIGPGSLAPYDGQFVITVINGVGTNGTYNFTTNSSGTIAITGTNLPNTTQSPTVYRVSWGYLYGANGCRATETGFVDITVNPLPAAPVVTLVNTVPAGGNFCPGTTIVYNVLNGNSIPGTFNWTAVDNLGATVGSGNNVPYGNGAVSTSLGLSCPIAANRSPITFTFTPFAAQGPTNCQGPNSTAQVNIRDVAAPTGSTASLNQSNIQCIASVPAAPSQSTIRNLYSDNCTATGSLGVTGPTSVTTGNACNFTITHSYVVSDACGNTTAAVVTYTGGDTQAPTWVTAPGALNRTVQYCDNTALANAQALAPVPTDNCNGALPAPTKVAGLFAVGSCPTQGTITNTFTVSDGCNTSVTYTQVITIVDTQGPSITGSNTQTLNIGAGANCQVSLPNYINGTGGIAPNSPLTPLTITDCAAPGGLFPAPPPIVWNQAGGNGTAVQSPAPGTLIVGAGGQVVPVTVTATDACGNQSTFTINVTLLDQTPPVARCHNATVTLSSTVNGGSASISPSQINGNNNNVVGNGTAPSGTPAGSGLGTGTFPSTDNCSPVPTPPLTLTFSTNAPTSTQRNFDCTNVGANSVTLVVTDAAGNFSTCTSTITVVDNTAPTFTCPGTQTLSKNANCITTLPNFQTSLGIVATDNCTPSGSITWTQTPAAGTIYGAGVTTATVTLVATDANGNNSTTCNITVNFVDNTPPQITCPGTVTAFTGVGNTDCSVNVTYTLPTAQDNCQGPGFPGAVTPVLVSGPASGGQFFVGTTPVTYRATDAAGNSATCTFNVVVNDNTVPTVVCGPNRTVSAGAGCTFTYNLGNAWNPTPFDNCLLAAVPFTWTLSGATSSIPFSANNLNGITFNLGLTTVTVTVRDASNNVSASCSFTVNVVDNALPAFNTCPSSFTTTTATNGLSGCRANVTLPVPTTTQNCTTVQEWFITSITSGTPNSSGIGAFPTSYPMNLGVTQVQYRLSDANGNSTTCTYNVTVNNANAGAITGTATAAQNAATTSTITFTGSGGTPNYCFTYDVSVNGGPFGAPQTVCTTGGQSVVTVAQSNAVVGTYQYRILSVTDANGCAGTLTNPTTATVTVVAGTPDLTSSQFFTTTQISAGGVIDEVIVLRNVGTAPTSGLISFTITNYTPLTGLTVTQTAAGTNVTVGIDTYTISSGWTFNAGTGTFTSNNVIPAGGSNNIGIRITRGTGGSAGANGSVTQTTTIAPGTGGGETPSTNNTISNTILKN